MATPTEHIAQLEQLLDNSTVNFHRFLSQAVKGHYNGTALGAVCIGWGGYPTHGGWYKGFFDFHLQGHKMLVVKAGGMLTYDGTTFLGHAGEGRGHRIRYLSSVHLPERKRTSGLDGPDTSWFDSLDASNDIQIDDATFPRVKEAIVEIKENEFFTLRKYAMQSHEGTGSFQLYNEDAFKGLIDRMFTYIPTPGAVARFKQAEYLIKALPSQSGDDLVLEPLEEGCAIQTIPVEKLKLDEFNKWNFKVGAQMPRVILSITSDKDALIASNWKVSQFGYGSPGSLYHWNEPRGI